MYRGLLFFVLLVLLVFLLVFRQGFDKNLYPHVRLWAQTLSGLTERLYIRSYENKFSTT